MHKQMPAQILVILLIIMMVVSLTVVTIATITIRNSRQVFSNQEFRAAYNSAETRIIDLTQLVSDPEFSVANLTDSQLIEKVSFTTSVPAEDIDCSITSGARFFCGFSEEGGRRTIVKVEDTNEVVDYSLSSGDYFGIILGNYTGQLGISWIGESAFELSLIYESLGVTMQQKQVVDSVNPAIYTTSGPRNNAADPQAGFLLSNPVVNNNSFSIDLSAIKDVPVGSILQYLNVKSVTRTRGTSITIRPESVGTLPNQVRRLDAFSYLQIANETSSPIITTQIPLNPQIAAPLSVAGNFLGLLTAYCGDNILSTREQCDDGNSSNEDACVAGCRNALCGDGYVWAGVEECDDANSNNNDTCVTAIITPGNNINPPVISTCRNARCGDGRLWNQAGGAETCDPLITSGVGHAPNCRPASAEGACTYCGDGIQNFSAGETCDDGALNGTVGLCNTTCNGIVSPPVVPPGPPPGPVRWQCCRPGGTDCYGCGDQIYCSPGTPPELCGGPYCNEGFVNTNC